MQVVHHEIELASEGHGHVYDVTEKVISWLRSVAAAEGQVTIFVPGSTAAV
ncbi:MAG: YjbQ family protein, partial [Deltaproteobacteria bacterium]|nr:YjbQ family protein [Deltaproteobacteria bacterium]